MDDPLFKVLIANAKRSSTTEPSDNSDVGRDFAACEPKVIESLLDDLRDLSISNIHNEMAHVETSLDSVRTRLVSLSAKSHSTLLKTCDSLSKLTSQFEQFRDNLHQLDVLCNGDRDFDATGTSGATQLRENFSNGARRTSAAIYTAETTALLQDVQALVDAQQRRASEREAGRDDTVSLDRDASRLFTRHQQSASVLLRNTDKVIEILELPSLVQACVRNSYYAEALDLWSLARRLVLRYPNHAIVADINTKVDAEIRQVMAAKLVKSLRTSTKMSTVSKSVGYLKRIVGTGGGSTASKTASKSAGTQPSALALTPTSIQLLFLASRLDFIKAQWATIESLKKSGSSHSYLKRYIEIFREHVFATVSTSQSLFGTSGSDATTATNITTIGNNNRLTSQYIDQTVNCLYSTLKEQAPRVFPPVALKSIWLQLAYCSQSLGRVGAEFWPMMQAKQDCPIPNGEWLEAIQKQRDLSRDVATRLDMAA